MRHPPSLKHREASLQLFLINFVGPGGGLRICFSSFILPPSFAISSLLIEFFFSCTYWGMVIDRLISLRDAVLSVFDC